jgi:hypothetical protein
MLENISLGCYLLYMLNHYIFKIDVYRSLYFLSIYSENNNKPVTFQSTDIQSAENCKGFPETIRQISEFKNKVI